MNNIKNSFDALVDRAMGLESRSHMRPVIEKELLHYDILFVLDKENLLDDLTFQGGTALRLCYGASRFSEDLDFAGGKSFHKKHLMLMKSCLEDYLGSRYGLEVAVKEPKDLSETFGSENIKVDKWQVRILTCPERRDIPKQMIKVEVVNIPAYTKEIRQLTHNYEFLPDGYDDVLVMTESLDEIMADKLIAFVNCQKYVRYRDIWDFRWLKQQGAVLKTELIKKKIEDYWVESYLRKLNDAISQLPTIILSSEFKKQMARFLPLDVQERTLQKEKFYDFLLKEVNELFCRLQAEL